MMKSRYALLWVLIALGLNAGHVQAKTVNQVVPFTQPDGTTFGARVFGDELEINWVTADGYAFVDSPTDDYLYYAELDSKGEYRASRAKVGIDDPATHGIEKHLQRSDARRAALQAERIARGYVRVRASESSSRMVARSTPARPTSPSVRPTTLTTRPIVTGMASTSRAAVGQP